MHWRCSVEEKNPDKLNESHTNANRMEFVQTERAWNDLFSFNSNERKKKSIADHFLRNKHSLYCNYYVEKRGTEKKNTIYRV